MLRPEVIDYCSSRYFKVYHSTYSMLHACYLINMHSCMHACMQITSHQFNIMKIHMEHTTFTLYTSVSHPSLRHTHSHASWSNMCTSHLHYHPHPHPHMHSPRPTHTFTHTPIPPTDYTCLERQLVDIGWFHIYKQTKCCTCTNTPQLAYTRAWHLRPSWPKQTKQEAPCVNQHTQKPYKYIRKWILSPPGQNVLLCRPRHRLYKKQLHWTNGRI